MQNPFTTTFSKAPQYTYIATDETSEILENFRYDSPSESVYKITGVRGSGKTVILAKIEEELRGQENEEKGWLVLDLNPTRDMLGQIAAALDKRGFGKDSTKSKSINVSATILGTDGGLGLSQEKENPFFDIGVEIDAMLQLAQKKGKKIFIGIDEVSKTPEMVQFASEFGCWLRSSYPVYLVCTGLYENMMEVSNVKNLTFFRRARTVLTEPLNMVRMSEMYKRQLKVSGDEARSLASITKGYAYAFQELGTLCFNRRDEYDLEDIVSDLKANLFSYSYEKIWEELSEGDRSLLRLLVKKEEYKREEILPMLGDKVSNYSVYRDRLLKKGLLSSRQGYIGMCLPFFSDYILEYC